MCIRDRNIDQPFEDGTAFLLAFHCLADHRGKRIGLLRRLFDLCEQRIGRLLGSKEELGVDVERAQLAGCLLYTSRCV